jgi:RNA polymerase sigma factor (sigma-70 family)
MKRIIVAINLPPDDASLVRYVQAGTPAEAEAAFGQLVVRHSSRLFLHLGSKGLTTDEQKEVANETWLRAWQRIGKFEYRGIDLFPWIKKISDFVVMEFLKSKYLRESREEQRDFSEDNDNEEAMATQNPEPSLVERLSIQEFREVVQQLLVEAPPDYRDIIEARIFLGLEPDEIKELYDWSRSKVDTTFYRAVVWIKKRFLERYGPADWLN